MQEFVIYSIKNLINGKQYIGKTSDFRKRKSVHLASAKNGNGYYIHNAIKKYGKHNFQWEIIECVDNENCLLERECYWISKLQPEYNLTSGGEGRSAPHKKQTKDKISKKLIGNKNGLGGIGFTGKTHSEEAKKKIGEASKIRRANRTWSTKKKVGIKRIAGGVTEWSKEQKAENARRIGKLKWWNDGFKNVRRENSPGDNWRTGRIKK